MRKHVLWVVLLVTFYCSDALAGAVFPCPKATSSKNGTFLVITEQKLSGPEGKPQRIEEVNLQVFPREEFINEIHRPTAHVTYWTNAMQWGVVFDRYNSPMLGCPLALVTDDGEFMVVLNTQPFASALWIYRRRDHTGDPMREGPDHGVLIREVALREIWPADKLATAQVYTDSTPLWFAGGRFDFSPDNRTLIHTTRWGNTVRVNLSDGSIAQAASVVR